VVSLQSHFGKPQFLDYKAYLKKIVLANTKLFCLFREKVEKSQRFQNLRNVFIEKEVDEFNKGLQSQGF